MTQPGTDTGDSTVAAGRDTVAWLDQIVDACDAIMAAKAALESALAAAPATPQPVESLWYSHGTFDSIQLSATPITDDLDWVAFTTVQSHITGRVHRTGQVEVTTTRPVNAVVLERLEQAVSEIAVHADTEGFFDAANRWRTAFRLGSSLRALADDTPAAHEKAAQGRDRALRCAAALLPTDERHVAAEVIAAGFTGTASQLHATIVAATS